MSIRRKRPGVALGCRSQKPDGSGGKVAARKLRQTLNTFGRVDELAIVAEHLFGTQRDLLNGSAVGIERLNAFKGEFDGGGTTAPYLGWRPRRWSGKKLPRNTRLEVPMTNQRERQTYYGAVNLLTRAFHLKEFLSAPMDSTKPFTLTC